MAVFLAGAFLAGVLLGFFLSASTSLPALSVFFFALEVFLTYDFVFLTGPFESINLIASSKV
ncbi:MAG: hypothetical protein ACKOPH_09465, partial [Methylocystis sp.]